MAVELRSWTQEELKHQLKRNTVKKHRNILFGDQERNGLYLKDPFEV